MSLVQMDHGRVDPERLEDSRAADPEQPVLREPYGPVPLVQPRGGPPLHCVVRGQLGVEQVERDSADIDPPDLESKRGPGQRHLEQECAAFRRRHTCHRQAVRIAVDPVLLLAPGDVEALAEVSAAVQETDSDHVERLVARFLQDVACEDAEAARVDRHRLVEAELGAHEHDRPGDSRPRPHRGREIRGDLLDERIDPRHQLGILLGGGLRRGPEIGEEAHGVAAGELPPVRVDIPENVLALARPAPAVVVGDAGERLQAVGQLVSEHGGARFEVERTGREGFAGHGPSFITAALVRARAGALIHPFAQHVSPKHGWRFRIGAFGVSNASMSRRVPVGSAEKVPLELVSSAANTLRIHSDAAGAAHLARELLGIGAFQVSLIEEQGQWQVVVRASDDFRNAVQDVIQAVRRCLAAGLAAFASIHIGVRPSIRFDQPQLAS